MSTATAKLKIKSGSRGMPEKTRAAILKAAIREFSEHGVAGARTDEIARAAGVNKALLYYYFHDKEALYGAVLDSVFSGLVTRVLPILESDLPPGDKIMRYVGAYFDFIARSAGDSSLLPRLVQHEMMRAGRNRSPHLKHLVEQYFLPLFQRVTRTLQQGIESGEFRPLRVEHFVPSMIAVTVFYFNSLPVIRLILPGDPLSPERIAERRAAVLDLIAAALFRSPEAAGESLAREQEGGPQ
ncbi:MAG TPA: TetR/AcrR family transcriptional regulator [Terriglobales bacterium]|nr:TetR/AcrR family transcriptional regulator [Terriglobales bacterium]